MAGLAWKSAAGIAIVIAIIVIAAADIAAAGTAYGIAADDAAQKFQNHNENDKAQKTTPDSAAPISAAAITRIKHIFLSFFVFCPYLHWLLLFPPPKSPPRSAIAMIGIQRLLP